MAWKKNKQDSAAGRQTRTPAAPNPDGSRPPANLETKKMSGSGNSVHIGKSLQVKGEITGSEDVTIDGKVEGKISLKEHRLTIGAAGRVRTTCVGSARRDAPGALSARTQPPRAPVGRAALRDVPQQRLAALSRRGGSPRGVHARVPNAR